MNHNMRQQSPTPTPAAQGSAIAAAPDSTLVRQLLELAEQAGQRILRLYEQHHREACAPRAPGARLADKADGSPLTRADLEAHQLIVQQLPRLLSDVAVVSEEGPELALQAGQPFWLVDPLDGTREFLAGNGEFSVNIALVRGGVVVWGVVHAPALGQSFWGGPGLGAWQRDAQGERPIHVAPPPAPAEPCRVVASRSHLDAATADFIRGLGRCELLQAGSSLKFCRVAQGLAHVYPRLGPTCLWDTAAAQAVLEGAGGCVHDLQGRPLRYPPGGDWRNPPFVAACAPLREWAAGRAGQGGGRDPRGPGEQAQSVR